MSFEIDVQNDRDYPVNLARLREALATTLTYAAAPPGSALTLAIVDDADGAALNHRFRGVDAATDVLSFPAGAPPVAVPGEPPYLGDLVIAFPYASAQAEREGQALADSLALLAVHGCLHLLGYDHDTPARKAAMWAAQADILRALAIPAHYLPALEGEGDDAAVS